MAQRRMIAKSISTSTKLAEVDNFAKLLFTWMIPHCDDYGHLDANPRIVKAIVVPLCDEESADVAKALDDLTKHGLIEKYEVEGRPYLAIRKWEDHQTLKTDRPLNQHAPLPDDEWNNLDSSRKPDGNKRKNKLSEVKVSEVKRSKDPKASLEFLRALPKEDIKEFMTRFSISEKQVLSKAEDLVLYCERKGKKYLNYRSFLLNSLKSDYGDGDKAGGKYAGMKKQVSAKP